MGRWRAVPIACIWRRFSDRTRDRCRGSSVTATVNAPGAFVGGRFSHLRLFDRNAFLEERDSLKQKTSSLVFALFVAVTTVSAQSFHDAPASAAAATNPHTGQPDIKAGEGVYAQTNAQCATDRQQRAGQHPALAKWTGPVGQAGRALLVHHQRRLGERHALVGATSRDGSLAGRQLSEVTRWRGCGYHTRRRQRSSAPQ